MSASQPRELDPLLIQLLEGEKQEGDADVRSRLAASPQLRQLWEELREVRAELHAAGQIYALDQKQEGVVSKQAEAAALQGFQRQMRPLERAPAAAAPRLVRASVFRLAAALCACVLVGILLKGYWDPGPERYLGAQVDFLIEDPHTAFGLLRWQPIPRALSYEVRVWVVEDESDLEPPLVVATVLDQTSYALAPELLSASRNSLHWQVRAYDAAGSEITRDELWQRR